LLNNNKDEEYLFIKNNINTVKKQNNIIILFIKRIINNPIIIKINHVYKKKSNLRFEHMRYNFQNIYKTRKIFKINYSYYPYIEINKSIS
jgi:hypothetical protein